jgi:magnesium chelatase family protein
MLACVQSATLSGVDGRPVAVEVHVSNGLPGFTVVGLPDAAIREARDRVRAALLSTHLPWPLRRVTVNLAPSGVRKSGAGLDLPIAIGLLVASGELPGSAVDQFGFLGELGLDGTIRSVPGAVTLVASLRSAAIVVPESCATEARLVAGNRTRAVSSLRELVDALAGRAPWPTPTSGRRRRRSAPPGPDLSDVRGQALGRRAIEVSAAGGHHLLLVGPPGSGKTLLATRLPGLLPGLTRAEALDVARVHSAAGGPVDDDLLTRRPPWRAPHHGTTEVALIGGGGVQLRPGEISLAHHGVLFLDELGEFPRVVLDTLRQPLEEGLIRVSRARGSVVLPARFLLVGAMNPCPCGEGISPGSCRCSEASRSRYSRRVSGPLLDRFDLAVTLGRPDPGDLVDGRPGEATHPVAARVAAARRLAALRGVRCNAELAPAAFDRHAALTPPAQALLERRVRSGSLSGRGLHRVRRVARTLADLDGATSLVGERHVAEALQLRSVSAPLGSGIGS